MIECNGVKRVGLTLLVALLLGCAAKPAPTLTPEPSSDNSELARLRNRAQDADIGVAENALTDLNSALRSARPVLVPESLVDVRLAKAGVHILNVLSNRTVVLGLGYGIVDETRVVGFDLVAGKVTWSYSTDDSVRSHAVRVRGNLYFVSDDRVIHCISINGQPRWAKRLTRDFDRSTIGPAITAVRERLFVPEGASIYIVDLDGEIMDHSVGEHISRDLAVGRRRVFSAVHNGPLLVLEETAAPRRIETVQNTAALSVANGVVCIVSFGPPYQLQCLKEETLRTLWKADLPNEVGAYQALEQDADNVYVLGQGRALAFRIADGKRLWATNEFTSGAFFKSFGRFALTRNARFELEWRDTSSGEVIARWGRRDGSYAHHAELIGESVLFEVKDHDRGDGLRLWKLPRTIARRVTTH